MTEEQEAKMELQIEHLHYALDRLYRSLDDAMELREGWGIAEFLEAKAIAKEALEVSNDPT